MNRDGSQNLDDPRIEPVHALNLSMTASMTILTV
jgi:hypothetical protein